MTAFRTTVESDEFARIMTNALAFFPARGIVDTALLRVWPDRIEATGTDTYTLGRDFCTARDFNSTGSAFPIRIELDHGGWKDIEAMARRDKKGSGVLEYRPGDCLIFTPTSGADKTEPVAAKDMTGQGTPFRIEGEEFSRTALWDMCDELLARLEGIDGDIRCFDPNLFGRFGKVKLPKSVTAGKVVDFIWQGEINPMLAKVGPTFVGAIMPINREKHADSTEDAGENLWPK